MSALPPKADISQSVGGTSAKCLTHAPQQNDQQSCVLSDVDVRSRGKAKMPSQQAASLKWMACVAAGSKMARPFLLRTLARLCRRILQRLRRGRRWLDLAKRNHAWEHIDHVPM